MSENYEKQIKARVEKWNGVLPYWYMGGGSSEVPDMLMNMNSPVAP